MVIATKFRALDAFIAIPNLENQIKYLKEKLEFLVKCIGEKRFNVDYHTSVMRYMSKLISSDIQKSLKPIKLGVDAIGDKTTLNNFALILKFLENLDNELVTREPLLMEAWKEHGREWNALVKDFESYCLKTYEVAAQAEAAVQKLKGIFNVAARKAA
jgi:hypothetical protein